MPPTPPPDGGVPGGLRFNIGRVLCADPPVVICSMQGRTSQLGIAPAISTALGARPACLLILVTSELETLEARGRFVSEVRRHGERFPHHRVVVLANTAREALLLQEAGAQAHLCNHNAFVDEDTFTIASDSCREFDAVYNARMAAYKRHELCAEVPSLLLVYPGVEPHEEVRRASVAAMLPRAVWANRIEGDALRQNGEAERAEGMARRRAALVLGRLLAADREILLPPARVAAWLGRARVGLCLSAREGAMFASMEYLLCGLPLVSTASLGGRDRYFEPDHCRIVADDPASVAEGVRAMIARDVDPREIRSAALAKVTHDRRTFVDFVQALLDGVGARVDFAARFAALRRGGLLRYERSDAVVGQLVPR